MKKNLGSVDKAIRMSLAIVLVALYFSGTVAGSLGIIGLVVALVLVLTSMVNFCPLYSLLGWNTRKIKTV